MRVFDELCKALRVDYADNALFKFSDYGTFQGQLETLNPAMFQNPEFCDRTLTQMITDYLSWYDDPSLRLVVGEGSRWQPFSLGYKAVRFEDELRVVEVSEERRLQAGDAIVGLNGMSFGEAYDQVERTLRSGGVPEREDWSVALGYAKRLEVRRADGAHEILEVKRYPVPRASDSAGEFFLLGDGAAGAAAATSSAQAVAASGVMLPPSMGILDIHDASSERFASLVKRVNEAAEAGLEALIVDARGSYGGGRCEAEMLLPLLIDRTCTHEEAFGDAGLLINCSRKNIDAKLSELEALRSSFVAVGSENAGESIADLDGLIADLRERRNTGFCEEPADEVNRTEFEPALKALKRVVLIVDRFTADAMEYLTRACTASGKACVIGRATCGSLDMALPRQVKLDNDFSLIMPMSKSLALRTCGPTKGRGIAPDIQVPWTPEFLTRDLDMECALRAVVD